MDSNKFICGDNSLKIKVSDRTFAEVEAMPGFKYERPVKQSAFLRWLMKTLSAGELKSTHFTYRNIGMERLKQGEPCLVLMNHSAFIDLKMAATILYPRPFHIVTTVDGFVGKNSLMRHLGCIPARKFITDTEMVSDIYYALHKLNSSVLMYPEASYSFDGTATPLPKSVGKALKLFHVPVVMIRTYGAFLHDPLYNGLRPRKVNVSADVTYLLSAEEVHDKTVDELNQILKDNFTFDSFEWQRENHVRVNEPFRAEGLERVLYKCPECLTEGKMVSSGTHIRCAACGADFELTEYGEIRRSDVLNKIKKNDSGQKERIPEFHSIPDWYAWERVSVDLELKTGNYFMRAPVRILTLVNTDAIYHVGSGVLTHDKDGFRLEGCAGALHYIQSALASYSVYADYFWYEIGDMICIGTPQMQFYCFPENTEVNVAKLRLAAEELYKMKAKRAESQ